MDGNESHLTNDEASQGHCVVEDRFERLDLTTGGIPFCTACAILSPEPHVHGSPVVGVDLWARKSWQGSGLNLSRPNSQTLLLGPEPARLDLRVNMGYSIRSGLV